MSDGQRNDARVLRRKAPILAQPMLLNARANAPSRGSAAPDFVRNVGLLVGSGWPYTQAQLLEHAANSEANAANVNLAGLQQSGAQFV